MKLPQSTPPCTTRKLVVLQPKARVRFPSILCHGEGPVVLCYRHPQDIRGLVARAWAWALILVGVKSPPAVSVVLMVTIQPLPYLSVTQWVRHAS